jgi:Na+-transporting NADH:ubiquinone oxidoreductase subunit B
VDSFSGATLLSQAAADAGALAGASWWDAFLGTIPGSMGETSTLACLLGAGFLILTRVASWRTMAGVVMGTLFASSLLNWAGSESNPMFAVPFHWHIVLGGWAIGTVFMATDPVSSSFTDRGRLVYGFGIGLLTVLVRVVNPAYPEGMMLAILFMNMFAPLIDYFAIQANIRRRMARSAA